MSWLSKFVEKRSGASNAINVEDQQGRYDTAMQGTNDGYADMMGMAKDQMNINSDSNQAKFAMMNQSAQDNSAENARLAQRGAASAGGAPAAAMAFQQQDMANKAQGAVTDQFQQGMFQQQEAGMNSMGGVLANQGQIAQSGFNMGESALEYNKKVARNATTRKMGMLGGALKIGGGMMMGNPMMAMGGAQQMMAQEGGPVGYNEGGQVEDPENPKPVGNGQSDKDTMLQLAMQRMQGSQQMMAEGGTTKYSPYPGDQIDAKLEPGEYVLNRNAVNEVGKENLDNLNNNQAPRFDKGKVKLRMGGYLYGN